MDNLRFITRLQRKARKSDNDYSADNKAQTQIPSVILELV